VGTRPKFTEYHANVIAKEIRQLFPYKDSAGNRVANMVRRGAYAAVALAIAQRIKDDGIADHMEFLHRCSPDNNRYPLTELWEDDDAGENQLH